MSKKVLWVWSMFVCAAWPTVSRKQVVYLSRAYQKVRISAIRPKLSSKPRTIKLRQTLDVFFLGQQSSKSRCFHLTMAWSATCFLAHMFSRQTAQLLVYSGIKCESVGRGLASQLLSRSVLKSSHIDSCKNGLVFLMILARNGFKRLFKKARRTDVFLFSMNLASVQWRKSISNS